MNKCNKCPYCQTRNLRKMIRTDGVTVLSIDEDNILSIMPEFLKAKINYCPMCGRKLSSKAKSDKKEQNR